MNELNQTQNRKHYTPEQKVQILRRHLLDRISISAVCEENQIHPTQFYQWQKQFFDNGGAAFIRGSHPRTGHREQQQIQALEDKLRRKDEVVAEIMEEMVRLKKNHGGN